MPVIRDTEARVTKTPNAVMTTYASPTQGGTDTALWRVDMSPATTGPLHTIDTEQIWTIIAGALTVTIDNDQFTATTGDTLILPADTPRQLHAHPESGFSAIATSPAQSHAYVPTSDPNSRSNRITPPWIA
ncbi:cupin domain-containing protein [Embleya hyalina]|uniref:Cupin n=1 Tax=Embleya hyalina TaxID=516124 RepID=A0A401YFJ2_9ACTN|nr:cupin domain-containing protein [Embleya hyalina]GCD93381.1 cupin [Embleya hyalina]